MAMPLSIVPVNSLRGYCSDSAEVFLAEELSLDSSFILLLSATFFLPLPALASWV